MRNKIIDVIIPCYNAHATINRCLASVAMQSISDQVKVTLVDDCSVIGYEGAVKFWEPLLDIQVVTLPENAGPGVARQAGMDETDGDYICFVDADDTLATSFSLEQMLKAAEEKDADIVSGRFVEECVEGFVSHGNDLVWVFAKLYRRRTIERFLVRFNNTRANEDTGFNALLSNLTDRIVNIPQTVYEWHWAQSTTTRKNNGAYTWASGHRGYIENMRWVVEELRRRNVNKEIIRSFAVKVLCRLYFMHEDVMFSAMWEKEESWFAVLDYYTDAIKPIVGEGALPFVYLSETFGEIQRESMQNPRQAEIMARMTFREYLNRLGYYADVKKAEEGSGVHGDNGTEGI